MGADPSVTSTPWVVWRWAPALVGALTATPAAAVAVADVRAGAALAVGAIPALVLGVPRDRRRRAILLSAGLILGIPMLVGATVAPIPAVAVATIVAIPLLATWSAPRLGRPRLSMLLITMAPPLIGLGFSMDGFSSGVTVTMLFVAGSVVAYGAALAIPIRWIADAPEDRPTPVLPGIGYGVRVALVGAITASAGFALDLDHVGWACAAALLVIRPDRNLQEWRTVGRFISVFVGALTAAAIVDIAPPAAVIAAALVVALAAAAATRGSRWYILPTFTTFLVILLLAYPDVGEAQSRLLERLGETVFGLAVAAIVGLARPALVARVRRPSNTRKRVVEPPTDPDDAP
ncbi:FUSC family protein [Gordonia soli]|uniref:Integral membrane bound transporter domain-containing protein n=1 Tax=Gordonia soli NBRC 108243 TaxID=1223545 RepID=M0QGS9_9ACTN|nr:FUSC family protein [Gordonia soli]GAC67649.1 hypothetical protein GS4_08_02340 [Gordonia soli NBRC 108243]